MFYHGCTSNGTSTNYPFAVHGQVEMVKLLLGHKARVRKALDDRMDSSKAYRGSEIYEYIKFVAQVGSWLRSVLEAYLVGGTRSREFTKFLFT